MNNEIKIDIINSLQEVSNRIIGNERTETQEKYSKVFGMVESNLNNHDLMMEFDSVIGERLYEYQTQCIIAGIKIGMELKEIL